MDLVVTAKNAGRPSYGQARGSDRAPWRSFNEERLWYSHHDARRTHVHRRIGSSAGASHRQRCRYPGGGDGHALRIARLLLFFSVGSGNRVSVDGQDESRTGSRVPPPGTERVERTSEPAPRFAAPGACHALSGG